MTRRHWKTILASAMVIATLAESAFAGRGGGGGGRGGGGGGRAGGMSRPGGGAGGGGGMNRPGGGMARPGGGNPGAGMSRPGGGNSPGAGSVNRNPAGNAPRGNNFQPQNNNRTPANGAGNRQVNQQNNLNPANRNPNVQAGNRAGNTNINNGNRTQVNNTTNRTNVGNSLNSGNRVTQNNINRTNNNYNITNVNSGYRGNGAGNYGGYRNYGGYGGWNNSYQGYHSNWVHGSWNNHYGGWGNNAAWFGAGLGLGAVAGWGLSSWAYSPSVYNWGYSSYSNPYYVPQQPIVIQQQPVVIQQAAPVYNYAQPINTQAAPPEQTSSDAALASFDQARDAFKAGDYPTALALTDQALARMPGDPAMHEFRALCLFAQGRYDAAASVLYGVLSAGPGWDWTTLASLYPEIGVYTNQLRNLETFTRANPNSAAAHFVLGYQYLTEGYTENADREFSAVTRLKPTDKLSAQLATQLIKVDETKAPEVTPAEPQPEPAPSPVPAGATLVGSWTASPASGVTIALNVAADKAFTWTVKAPGQTTNLGGASSYEDGILTLAQKSGQPLVGRVTWRDPTHMVFKIVDGPPEDPGLSFAK
ncbi:MAG: hypothetical protein JWN86_668 [Planctomycetota bacterium]|nr:hypothetical protein [Planctomycetota bacterium]